MKIYYSADIEKRSYEGRTSIALAIKEHLAGKGHKFVNHPKEADIIHLHSSGIFDSYNAYKLKRKYKIPCIFSLYSIAEAEPIFHMVNWFSQRKITKKYKLSFLLSYSAILPIRLRGIFLRKLDKVVVASNYSRKKLYKNTELIHFGVDLKKFRPLKEPRSSKIKIGYFGHPSVFKGITDFVKAASFFPKDAEIYIYSTRLTKELNKYIQKRNKRIIIRGFVEDINKAYNEMDIIVIPYRNSLGAIANPLALLESMAVQSAIITTKVPFIKEIVRDTAITVEPYAPKQIAKAVHLLAKDPVLRQELGKKARAIVTKSYDKKDMLRRYEALYEELSRK